MSKPLDKRNIHDAFLDNKSAAYEICAFLLYDKLFTEQTCTALDRREVAVLIMYYLKEKIFILSVLYLKCVLCFPDKKNKSVILTWTEKTNLVSYY